MARLDRCSANAQLCSGLAVSTLGQEEREQAATEQGPPVISKGGCRRDSKANSRELRSWLGACESLPEGPTLQNPALIIFPSSRIMNSVVVELEGTTRVI